MQTLDKSATVDEMFSGPMTYRSEDKANIMYYMRRLPQEKNSS